LTEGPIAGQSALTWRRWYPAWAYTLLVIYASLYPLAGWHDSGTTPLGFLTAGWPRYTTAFDLISNAVAYLPLGALWFVALRRRLPAGIAVVVALVIGAGLSLILETVQTYLPSRVPSNLDLANNALGTVMGICAGVRWGGLLDSARWLRWRERVFVAGEHVDLGLLLLAAWLLTQLSTETLLFGSGNLRQMLDLPPTQPFLAERFIQVEAGIAAAGLLAAGLMTSMLLKRRSRLRRTRLCLGLFVLVIAVKTFAYALLMDPTAALVWITPGNTVGVGLGLLLWTLASFLEVPLQRAIAALALLLVTVMVNIAPENPYLANTLESWNPGHFLNFNGLTRLVSSLWPFLALPWLMLYRERS